MTGQHAHRTVSEVVVTSVRAAGVSPTALILTYNLLALYGVLSGWVGVRTLDVVGGPLWALVWPIGIVFFSMAAVIGLLVSRKFGIATVELVTTIALVSLLIGYSVAIVVRTGVDGDLLRLPVAVLPVALSVHPFSRLVRIARGSVVAR
jgi:hypothetical protein